VQQEATNTGKQLASLGKLLALIGIFMDMIGGPKIPDLAHMQGVPLNDVLKPIDELVTVLMTIRKAIPFPPAAPGASRVL
jgi:hypothetical protein